MRTHTKLARDGRLGYTFLIFLAIVLTPAPGGAQMISRIDLGTLGGTFSTAIGINNAGQVVGYSKTPSGGLSTFVWQNGVMTGLGTLSGHDETGFGIFNRINAAGQVVGNSYTAKDELHSFLVTPEDTDGDGIPDLWFRDDDGDGINDLMRDLGTLGGNHTQATAMNDAAQVVGGFETANGYLHPFIWQNGVITDLGTLGGPGEPFVTGFSPYFEINARGQVVGRADTPSGEIHAFLVTPEDTDGDEIPDLWFRDDDHDGINDLMTDLGTLGGGDTSQATDINDAGQVIGNFDTASEDTHGFIWQNGVMTDLGSLGGNFILPDAINNAGQVVGSSETVNGDFRAFLWQDGIMKDLGTLAGASSYATAINEVGQVVGSAETTKTGNLRPHAYVVTPEDINGDGIPDRWFRDSDGDGINDLMIDLDTPDGVSSGASGINEAGQVAGDLRIPSGEVHGGEVHAFLFLPPPPPSLPAILFLHGILSDNMYRGPEMDRVWPPEFLDFFADLSDMSLTEKGEQRLDVYPKEQDLVKEIPVGRNIYKRWLLYLQQLKDDGVISDWYAYTYDWRLDWRDIVKNGTLYSAACFTEQDGSFQPQTCDQCGACVRLDDKIRELAGTNRQVWIVTHSNGGLVAKTLLTLFPDLREHLAGLILVAAPQLGTPQSLLPLLHGEEKILLGPLERTLQESTRVDARSWPNPYALLPNEEYFQRVSDPVIEFQTQGIFGITNPFVTAWSTRYSGSISDLTNMEDFLLGNPVRPRPLSTDTGTPEVLYKPLFTSAQGAHQLIEGFSGSNFDPPLPVYQIVGWGLSTVRGIKYKPKLPLELTSSPMLGDSLDHDTLDTCDGDITVVVPSASALTDATTFYLNLRRHNRGIQRNRRHRDILEVVPVQELIKDIIQGEESPVIEYISSSIPATGCKGARLRVRSPATIHIYQDGLHTGPIGTEDEPGLIEEDIPNSQYRSLGEGKESFVDDVGTYQVEIVGTGTGTVTLEGDRFDGDAVEELMVVPLIPIRKGSLISFVLDPNLDVPPQLLMDIEGDGTPDFVLPTDAPPGTEVSLAVIRSAVKELKNDTGAAGFSKRTKRELHEILRKAVLSVDKAKKEQRHGRSREVRHELKEVQESLEHYRKRLDSYVARGRASKEAADALTGKATEIENLVEVQIVQIPDHDYHRHYRDGRGIWKRKGVSYSFELNEFERWRSGHGKKDKDRR